MMTQTLPNIFPAPYGIREDVERRIISRLREYAEYNAERDAWYRDGDGRPVTEGGKGYSFPACIHGRSNWTDYDNICGACEDGYGYWDAVRELDDAYCYVMRRHRETARRLAKVRAMTEGERLPDSLLHALFDWVMDR